MSTFVVPPTATPVEFRFVAPRPQSIAWLFFGRPKAYRMPLVQNLPQAMKEVLGQSVAGVSQANLDEVNAKRIWDAGLSIIDHYAPGVPARLKDDQLIALVRAWYAASNITMGESSASSTS